MGNYSKCCTCGYEWRSGMSGSHSCADKLQKENQALRKELEAVKAASLIGYIENMEQIDIQASIRGEAGMRMMTSFAVKTAKEYANKLEG